MKSTFHISMAIIQFVVGTFLMINGILNRIQAIVWYEQIGFDLYRESVDVSEFVLIVGLGMIGLGILNLHFYSKEREKETLKESYEKEKAI